MVRQPMFPGGRPRRPGPAATIRCPFVRVSRYRASRSSWASLGRQAGRQRGAAGRHRQVRRTKIVASLGPASWDEPVLRKMIAAGADVIRINLSHGDPATQLALIDRVRQVSRDEASAVAVLVDLPGPKLRTAPFPDGGIELVPGDTIQLRCGE